MIEFIFAICRSKTPKPQWYWRCRASNKKIRCISPDYATRGSCHNSIKSFTKHLTKGIYRVDDPWRERLESKRMAHRRS